MRWISEGLLQRAIQGVKQFGNRYLVDTGAMFEGLQVGDLTLVAVELELLKYGEGFGMLPDDVGDNHILSDHGTHLVALRVQPVVKGRLFVLEIILRH